MIAYCPETIDEHPLVLEHPRSIATKLVDKMRNMADFQIDMLMSQQVAPVDAFVGDDVSGRVPTLITREVMKHAYSDGLVEAVPHVFFLAPNRYLACKNDDAEEKHVALLTRQVGQYKNRRPFTSASVVTEFIQSGASIHQIMYALEANGVCANPVCPERIACDIYVGLDDGQKRADVGMQKEPGAPVTQRAVHYSQDSVNQMRGFIRDYAGVLYSIARAEM